MADTAKIPVVLKVAQIYQDAFAGVPASTVVETYDNPGHPLDGFPYVWDVLVEVTPTSHSDSSTQTANFYNALDIVPGMWLADNSHRSYKIIELIDSAADGAANYKRIRIKDVGMYTALSEPTPGNGANDNTPVYEGGNFAYIFTLSEDGLPNFGIKWLGPPEDISFINNITSRFQYRNLLTANYNNSDSPNPTYSSYQVGQMVYLDSNGIFQPLVASDAAQVKKRFGVITSVNVPEDGDLGVRPWGKIVGDLDLSSFTVGDALYYDDTDPANDGSYLTATEPASSAIPMYIKISNTTGMYITDMVGGGDQIYNSLFSNPTETVFTVGGVDAGTPVEDLDGQTISQVLDMIFFPPTCPTPVQPTTGFSDSPDVVHSSITTNYLYLVGDTLNSTFSFTASPGSVPGQGDFAGPIVSATLTLPDNTNVDVHSGSGFTMNNYNLTNYEVPLGIQNWQYSVVFGDGPDVLDSYGDPNCPSYSQSTMNINRKLEGVYPVFAGTSAIYTPGAVSNTWDSSMDPSTGNASWSPVALFSFETLSNKVIAQSYGESDNVATWVNHRFAVPNALGLSSIDIDAGQLGWQNAITSFDVIGGLTLTINGQSVGYTIYERVNADAGGANNYRLVW